MGVGAEVAREVEHVHVDNDVVAAAAAGGPKRRHGRVNGRRGRGGERAQLTGAEGGDAQVGLGVEALLVLEVV